MNKRQKIVQEQFLNNEEAVIRRLKQVYGQSLRDIEKKSQELQNQITGLQAALDTVEDAAERERLKSMIQSKVYQKQYQDALKKQIGSILDNMQVEGFKTISEYLQKCYEDGFLGTMYDLQGQGIPLCFPLDQEAMVRAVQLDSKIKEGLYEHLGEDVKMLKKHITAQVSRGISTGMSFQQIAQQLSGKMIGTYQNPGGSLAYAMRIARTEGHRIQVQGAMDACYKAKDKGADVLKQWDAALDSRTRESHQAVDGEIRELDEPFSNGLMFPGDPAGGAAEVVNCRCALLQRARWALDEEELETLKERAEYFGLDKADSFDDFKKKYLKAADDPVFSRPAFTPAKTIQEAEAFADQFVDANGFGAIGTSYAGVHLDVANEVNRALSDVYGMFDIPKLGGIAAPAKNTKLGKMVNAHAAYSPIRRSILMDRTKTKKASTMLDGLMEDKKAITNILTHPERYDFTKITTRLRNVIEASRPTGRSIVPETITESIIHELGHHIEKSISKADWDVIKAGMGTYAQRISGYAADSPSEYLAESFTAYMRGEDCIDPAVRDIFDRMRK